ncbi:MAG TPA: LacI family DNA-binding transcriptional regulator [Devosia sp.]|nr:LacI family DNA-binding transcriptional regulator [Devosia sp.]
MDVAREAGLSRATVSYVFNRDSRQSIPEATRQRVLDAAARLGYRPYGPARLLRGGRSSVVLMLTPGLAHASDFVAAGIINRLGEALRKHGLHLVWQLGTEERDTSIDLAPSLVLTSAAEGEPLIGELSQQFSVPVLSAFPGLDAFIGSASVAQVEHVAARGRKHIAYAAPVRTDLAPTSKIRLAATTATAKRLRLPRPVAFTVPANRTEAATALQRLLNDNPAIDAICAYNDEVAFAVLAAAHDGDIAVPKRIAVIGIDNHPFGEVAIPALTTVESDVTQFVEAFAEQVARLANNLPSPAVVLPELAHTVERASA